MNGPKFHLVHRAVMQAVSAGPWTFSVGWPERPTISVWRDTKAQVEGLLGYEIVEWGAFTNPKTGWFWIQVADSRYAEAGKPLLESVLRIGA